MSNGSPFIDFAKTGPAPADVWLTPFGPGGYNKIWEPTFPARALGK